MHSDSPRRVVSLVLAPSYLLLATCKVGAATRTAAASAVASRFTSITLFIVRRVQNYQQSRRWIFIRECGDGPLAAAAGWCRLTQNLSRPAGMSPSRLCHMRAFARTHKQTHYMLICIRSISNLTLGVTSH